MIPLTCAHPEPPGVPRCSSPAIDSHQDGSDSREVGEAGVEIEDPFGLDPNDLPMDELCAGIAREAEELVAAGT